MINPDDLICDFERRFGRTPRVYRAPGRVNLIGEHTDYNDGFVLPMALDRSTWVAAAPRDDRTIVVRSREYRETATFDLNDVAADPRVDPAWSRYVRGVAAVLDRSPERLPPPLAARATADAPKPSAKAGALLGADLLIASDVPIGAGLSSSAALEVAC